MELGNPKIDEYFRVQGLQTTGKGEVNVATAKYNVVNLRTITLDQAINLYNDKVPYLIPTEKGIKYMQEKAGVNKKQLEESEAQLKAKAAAEDSEKNKKA